MEKKAIIKAGVLGGVGVLFGAFGAHALKGVLTADQLLSFNTGVRYQMVHALAILALVFIYAKYPQKAFKVATLLFFIGVIFFSGSIYLLSIREVAAMPWLTYLGPITPLGGTMIIAGWVCVVIGGWKIKKD